MATTVDLVSARLPTRSCLNACRHWTAFISATYALLQSLSNSYTHTHTHLTALFPGLPRWAGTRKVKPVWILLMQETVSGSGISWAVCKSASRSRQITRQEPTTQFFTGWMPFLLPNQQRQSTEVLSLHSPITLTANTSKIAYSCQISDYMTKTKNMPDPI